MYLVGPRVWMLTLTIAASADPANAQQPALAPEIDQRMAKEKEARQVCKIEICKAFAQPAGGAPLTCDVTKTWTQPEIASKIAGGSYLWQYGHVQCTFKLSLERELVAKALADGSQLVKFPQHTFDCNVDDKDAAKGKAFTVSLSVTPAVSFENRQAKSVALDPVKVEGSTLASAAVSSVMTVDKVSGVVSKAATTEINHFLYAKCKEDGVEVPQKRN